MRGVVIRVAVVAALLTGAFVLVVVALNHTVYSPAGFVRTYVDALARKDVAAALRLAGPAPSSSALDDLLAPEVMADLEDVHIAEVGSEAGLPEDHRLVEVDFTANGRTGTARFEVERTGTVLGLFQSWAFSSSPLAQIDLTLLHTREFTANGESRVTPVTDASATYLAFSPGVITFDHASPLTEADERTVVLATPGRATVIQLAAEANAAFIELVQEETHRYLDECAAQQVFFPSGCPFGQEIADRVAPGARPAWTISQYPVVSIQPTSTLGQWQVPGGDGIARLHVDIQSIYDGSIDPLDTDVPFRVNYIVTFVGESQVVLTPRGE